MRWPVCANLSKVLIGQRVLAISRRAKYLLFSCTHGTLIVHLGMSGKLSIVDDGAIPAKHDHLDFVLDNNLILRYTDPRRFGSVHWTTDSPAEHRLLAHLGVEPLTADFSGQYLFTATRNKRTPIKTLLMDAAIVVGVGNIYANEALFFAGIRPNRPAHTLALPECVKLVQFSKKILRQAIKKGGTTLKDFFNADGKPGYFTQNLMVYGRNGQHCSNCNALLQSIKINQRATVFCPSCQS